MIPYSEDRDSLMAFALIRLDLAWSRNSVLICYMEIFGLIIPLANGLHICLLLIWNLELHHPFQALRGRLLVHGYAKLSMEWWMIAWNIPSWTQIAAQPEEATQVELVEQSAQGAQVRSLHSVTLGA
jgi:hypothetical protein